MIRIDLRNLTDDVVAEAIPHLGECRYAAPCIIGALIPADQRNRLDYHLRDGQGHALSGVTVAELIDLGEIAFPDERQAQLAGELQLHFDNHGLANHDFDRKLAEVRKELNIHA